jgi:biotin carboxylase
MVLDLAAGISYPAVLKPAYGESSRDVVLVDSIEAVTAELSNLGASHVTGAILEEYIDDRGEDLAGPFAGYVSVESVLMGGSVQHVAVTGRAKLAPPFRESGAFIPSALTEPELREVCELTSKALSALGFRHGCAHTEIKLTPDGPRVIEVNGRIGGGGISMMLKSLAGIDLLEVAARTALDERFELELPALNEVAFDLQVQPTQSMRTIEAISGLDDLSRIPGVESVTVNRGPGESVDWRAGSQEYVFSVTGRVSDHTALAEMFQRILSTTNVVAT